MTNGAEGFVVENPTLIRGRVYDKIKKEILSGKIRPGSGVLEGRLAKALNVSRTPVREALHVLEMEGFLESFPRVGYRVRQITWEEALEIYEIRAVLEPLAARKAMEGEDRSYIDVLERAIAESEAACIREQREAFFQYDALFDEVLVKASNMKSLIGLWATLRHRLKLYRMEVQGSVTGRLKAVAGHRRIVECLRAGDQEAVKAAIQAHLDDFKQDVRRVASDWPTSRPSGR